LPGDAQRNWEPVEVTARFSRGMITPLYFIFRESRFDISRLDYRWSERKGKDMVYYFNVSDKSDHYCLCLDTLTMSWSLLSGQNP